MRAKALGMLCRCPYWGILGRSSTGAMLPAPHWGITGRSSAAALPEALFLLAVLRQSCYFAQASPKLAIILHVALLGAGRNSGVHSLFLIACDADMRMTGTWSCYFLGLVVRLFCFEYICIKTKREAGVDRGAHLPSSTLEVEAR